jgi:hypothetical protein
LSLQPRCIHRRRRGVRPVVGQEARPIHGVLVADHSQCRTGLRLARIQSGTVLLGHGHGIGSLDHALLHQAVRIQLSRRRVLADLRVHHRLGCGRLVGLVVTETAVADQVDHDVLVEALPVIQRLARDKDHCLRIVSIDVENWGLEHLGHIAAIHRRPRVVRIAGRESDLIVDDHVHRAARVERTGLRQLQGLHDDALAGECSVAVDQDRQDLRAQAISAAFLPGTHGPLHDRIDDLQVRWIERQRHMHIAAACTQVGGETLVVLHVAGTLLVRRVVAPLELGEQLRRRLAEHVDQYVQPAAMRHADDDLLRARLAAALHEVVQQRNQRIAAFQREALLPHVARVEVSLQHLGRRKLPQDVLSCLSVESLHQATAQELVLQPQSLVGVRDMRELRPYRPREYLLHYRHDVAQPCPARQGIDATAGKELGVEVRGRQAHVVELHHAGLGPLQQAERIELGDQVTAIVVDLDQARDGRLPFALGTASGLCVNGPWLPGPLFQRAHHRGVRRVGACGRETCKVPAPVVGHVLPRKVSLVEILDPGGIGGTE